MFRAIIALAIPRKTAPGCEPCASHEPGRRKIFVPPSAVDPKRPRPLTQEQIDALTPRPARYVIYDPSLPGFGVRVSTLGTKTYVLRYRLHSGRERWKVLGRVGAVPLEKARRQAKTDVGIVASSGDPLRAKDRAREASTFGDVATAFLTEHVDARLKRSTRRNYKLAIEAHLRPRLSTIPITDVAPSDLARLHHQLRATPYLANRVIATASKLFAWAEQHGYRERHSNPCDGIEPYKEVARKRYLTPAELQRVGAALRIAARYNAIAPAAIAAIRLLLFTGARVSEILGLRWSEVDLATGVLRLEDSKTGARIVILNQPAIEILRTRPRHVGSLHVFPGEGRSEKRKGLHRVSLADPWAWVRRRARLPDVRVHDLRHSYASVAASTGHSLPIIGGLLGHSQPQTTARYAHLLDDPLRAASATTGATIEASLERSRARRDERQRRAVRG